MALPVFHRPSSPVPQPRRLEFETDDEQQEDDAQFGDVQDVVGIGDHLQRRADDDAGEQVTEHGAEAELLEDRRGNHRAAEQE